jgi:hypothetical protein
MPFYIRVPSLITPVHCITQTEEPKLSVKSWGFVKLFWKKKFN